MSVQRNYLELLEPGKTYHVYNRSNDHSFLFRQDEDFIEFLFLLKKYLFVFADLYAWALLPNHFHMIIRIKDEISIRRSIELLPVSARSDAQKKYLVNADFSSLVTSQFRRLFTSYSMKINRWYKRRGNLFNRQFKRVEIKSDIQLIRTTVYIHANAMKHKIVSDFKNYRWTSYHDYVNNIRSKSIDDFVKNNFSDTEQFIEVHEKLSEYHYACRSSIEL